MPLELDGADSCAESWDRMIKPAGGCAPEPSRSAIAPRSFSIAASVLGLATPMTIDSLPSAKRILSETAPRLAGSSEISSSLTDCGDETPNVLAPAREALGEASALA